uniref:Uncharacterized protein n=1 Tax=Strongyloides stercoralis TaxID=6248 RepID=A0A0K0ET20_STRER
MNQKVCLESQIFSATSFLKELNINNNVNQLEHPMWEDKKEEEGCKNVVKNIHININVSFFKNIPLKLDENLSRINVSIFYETIHKVNELFEYTRGVSLSIFPSKVLPLNENKDVSRILPVKNKRNEYINNSNMSQTNFENNNLTHFSRNMISNCTFNYTEYFLPYLFNFSSYTSSIYSFVKFSSTSCEKFIQSLNNNIERSCFIAKCKEDNKTWKSCSGLSSSHIFIITIVPEKFQINCQKLIGLELININLDELEKSYEYESLPSINLKLPNSFFYPFSCDYEEE